MYELKSYDRRKTSSEIFFFFFVIIYDILNILIIYGKEKKSVPLESRAVGKDDRQTGKPETPRYAPPVGILKSNGTRWHYAASK